MKQCKICKENKPLEEFYKISKARSHHGDGHDTRCKDCVKKLSSRPEYRKMANAAKKLRLNEPAYLKKYNEKKNRWQRKQYAESEEFRKSERERIKEWEHTEHGKALKKVSRQQYQKTRKYKKAIEKYRKQNPQKRLAQYTLYNAIARGKIHRPDKCSICNKPCIPEGHHSDYSKPLDVVWMCKQCHVAYHWSAR